MLFDQANFQATEQLDNTVKKFGMLNLAKLLRILVLQKEKTQKNIASIMAKKIKVQANLTMLRWTLIKVLKIRKGSRQSMKDKFHQQHQLMKKQLVIMQNQQRINKRQFQFRNKHQRNKNQLKNKIPKNNNPRNKNQPKNKILKNKSQFKNKNPRNKNRPKRKQQTLKLNDYSKITTLYDAYYNSKVYKIN